MALLLAGNGPAAAADCKQHRFAGARTMLLVNNQQTFLAEMRVKSDGDIRLGKFYERRKKNRKDGNTAGQLNIDLSCLLTGNLIFNFNDGSSETFILSGRFARRGSAPTIAVGLGVRVSDGRMFSISMLPTAP